MKRVVVTGMGAITPIGNSIDAFWESVKAGKIGFDRITYFDTADYKCKLAAQVKNFDAYRVGCAVGSGIGSLQAMEREHSRLLEKGPSRVAPMLVPLMISNMAAGNVSIAYNLKGKSINVVTACATGTNSIGEAYRTIQYGDVPFLLTRTEVDSLWVKALPL